MFIVNASSDLAHYPLKQDAHCHHKMAYYCQFNLLHDHLSNITLAYTVRTRPAPDLNVASLRIRQNYRQNSKLTKIDAISNG